MLVPRDDKEGGIAVRYGDVFAAGGELAPGRDDDRAAGRSMRVPFSSKRPSAGPPQLCSPRRRAASVGAVVHGKSTGATAKHGVTVSDTRVPGGRIVTEFFGDVFVPRPCTLMCLRLAYAVCAHVL